MCCPHRAQSNVESLYGICHTLRNGIPNPHPGAALGAEGLSALNKVRGALPEEPRAPEVPSLNTVRQAGEAVRKQGEAAGRK